MSQALSSRGTPLGPQHFKARSAVPLSSLPATARLGTRIATVLPGILRELADAPWRVTLDRVEDISGADSALHAIRFETRQGSIPCRLKLDAAAISALIEAAMGGSGSEEPYALGDRPLSAIERQLLSLAHEKFGRAAAAAIETELDRPVSIFTVDNAGETDGGGEWVAFRFLMNLFGYSGEITLLAGKQELALQIKDASGSEAESRALDASRQQLQREVAKSELVFSARLAEEMLPLHDMASLKPGSLLRLAATASGPVFLSCNGITSFEGVLARSGEHLAVTIRPATG